MNNKFKVYPMILILVLFISLYFIDKITYSTSITSELISFDYSLYVDNEKNIIKYITEETKVSEIIGKVNISDEYSKNIIVTNDKGTKKDNNNIINTGDILSITIENEEFKYGLSVIGDTNADGDVTLTDLSQLRKHVSGFKINETGETYKKEGLYYHAIDMNMDESVSLSDLSKLRKMVAGTEEIYDIKLNYKKIEMNVGNTKNIKYYISPSNVQNKEVIWTSSDTSVATVDTEGKVTAKSAGTTNITANTNNGKTATCKINVVEKHTEDKIHFIGNGDSFGTFLNKNDTSSNGPSPSETIVLESNGKFALIDTGLKNSNSLSPERATNVVNYLKKIGATELEFIIVTHVHYDHMGGASYIIDNIKTKKLYTKVYYANDNSTESAKENSVNRYNSLYEKTTDLGIFEKINSTFEGKILTLGNMEIKLLGTKNMLYYDECKGQDENMNSIITHITVNDKKILLTGDMVPATTNTCLKKYDSNCSGTSLTECIINNNDIDEIDLLKLPHHGYDNCDITKNIASTLNPKYIVIGNWEAKVDYYYIKGTQNDNGIKMGPLYSGTPCIKKYFQNWQTTGDEKNAFYVNNNNVVFDFSETDIKIYNN